MKSLNQHLMRQRPGETTVLAIVNEEYTNRRDIQTIVAVLDACKDSSLRLSLAIYTGPSSSSIE